MKILLCCSLASMFAVSAFRPAAQAQTYSVFHTFAATSGNTSTNDGAQVSSSLLLSSNVLYGSALTGESNGLGTLFKVNTDGSGFTNFFVFPLFINGVRMGGNPMGGLIQSNGVLYGTAEYGGTNYRGSIFSINPDGSGYSVLHMFDALGSGNTNGSGGFPQATLTMSGSVLFGTTYTGGTYGHGTVFSINADGSDFTSLFSFNQTNGAVLSGSVVVDAGRIYGVTMMGGSAGYGVIFAMDTNGSNFSVYHDFTGNTVPPGHDGGYPNAGLVLINDTLYGTCTIRGLNGGNYGTVFAINTNNTGYRTIYNFDSNHGFDPYGALFYKNGLLYGTAYAGPGTNTGSVFSMNTDGTGLVEYFNFPGGAGANLTNSVGAKPMAGVVVDDSGSIFGATYFGGTGGNGVVFGLVSTNLPAPILYIQSAPTVGYLEVIWYNTNYLLQSSLMLPGVYTTIPGAASPYLFQPTNNQQFFRLIHQ